jgi:hypothetical protein
MNPFMVTLKAELHLQAGSQLVAAQLEVLEPDLAVVEGGVQFGESVQ